MKLRIFHRQSEQTPPPQTTSPPYEPPIAENVDFTSEDIVLCQNIRAPSLSLPDPPPAYSARDCPEYTRRPRSLSRRCIHKIRKHLLRFGVKIAIIVLIDLLFPFIILYVICCAVRGVQIPNGDDLGQAIKMIFNRQKNIQ